MTRLLLIDGKSASMYLNRDHIHQWDTAGEPIDLGHYEELYPLVFDADWAKFMADKGRNFPQIKKIPKNVEIIF